MGFYGFTGFGIGFVVGVIVNAYLLRGVSREIYMKDKSKRMKYGALNWGIAFLGMIIGMVIGQTKI